MVLSAVVHQPATELFPEAVEGRVVARAGAVVVVVAPEAAGQARRLT